MEKGMIPKHFLTAECGMYDTKLFFNYNAANPIAVDRCVAIDDFESRPPSRSRDEYSFFCRSDI